MAREKWPSAAGGVTDVPRSVQQSLSRGRVLDLSQEVGDGCECEVAYVVGQLWGHVGRFEMPVAVAAGVPGAGDWGLPSTPQCPHQTPRESVNLYCRDPAG